MTDDSNPKIIDAVNFPLAVAVMKMETDLTEKTFAAGQLFRALDAIGVDFVEFPDNAGFCALRAAREAFDYGQQCRESLSITTLGDAAAKVIRCRLEAGHAGGHQYESTSGRDGTGHG